MELFSPMKAETINKGIYFEKSNIMQMPTAQSQGFFVAEISDPDKEIVEFLKIYIGIR